MRRWVGTTDFKDAWTALGRFEGNLAFNVGANIGQAATLLAERFDTVVACEPCAESFEILNAEAPANVRRLHVALSDHEGTVTLTESEQSIQTGQLTTGGGLHWGPKVGEREVPCLTVDRLSSLYGQPDLVQVDTEGHEVMVLAGAAETLANGTRLFVEVHAKANEQPIRELTPGYEWEWIRWPARRPGSVLDEHFWGIGRPA